MHPATLGSGTTIGAPMFNSLSDRLNDTFDRLRGKGKLTEADISSAMRDIRMALLEADVNFKEIGRARTSLPRPRSAASRPRSWIRSPRRRTL